MMLSTQFNLQHNAEIAKRNAQIYMHNFRVTKLAFYLNYAILETCQALQLKKQIRGAAE